MRTQFIGMLIIATTISLLASCATLVAPSIMVKVPSANNAEWNFSATKAQTPLGKVSLFINEALIGSDYHVPANIKGTYRGHAIQAVCPTLTITSGANQTTCKVYVDGVMVVTLDF